MKGESNKKFEWQNGLRFEGIMRWTMVSMNNEMDYEYDTPNSCKIISPFPQIPQCHH